MFEQGQKIGNFRLLSKLSNGSYQVICNCGVRFVLPHKNLLESIKDCCAKCSKGNQ